MINIKLHGYIFLSRKYSFIVNPVFGHGHACMCDCDMAGTYLQLTVIDEWVSRLNPPVSVGTKFKLRLMEKHQLPVCVAEMLLYMCLHVPDIYLKYGCACTMCILQSQWVKLEDRLQPSLNIRNFSNAAHYNRILTCDHLVI